MSTARTSMAPTRTAHPRLRAVANRARRRTVGAVLVASLCAGTLVVGGPAGSPPAAADVTTNSADNLRTGWYGNQPKLSPAAVAANDFGLLGSMPVVGQVYAQPVIHDNVLIAATEGNNIYGFDATTRAKLWERNVGPTFDARSLNNCGDLRPEVGITSTPVVDPATGTVYVMSKVGPAGSPNVAWYLHAADVRTGAERPGWPVKIEGTADNDPSLAFNAKFHLQRPGLLLMDGVVYAGFAGHCDAKPFYGWISGVSTSTGEIRTLWSTNVSPGAVATDGPGGGIWQSGGGLVSDAPGEILFSTGNGTPPPSGPGTADTSTLGQSLVRVRVQPDGTLKHVDHFAPYDASVLNETDSDVGSGSPVALPPEYFGTAKYPRLSVLIGKQGYIWMNDATDLGGVGQGPSGSDKVINRIGKLNGGVRGKPGVWPGEGGYVYIATSQSGAGTGRLLAFKYGLDGAGNPTLTNTGKSSDLFGFGSGSPVITSDGTKSGSALVWVTRFGTTYDPAQPGVGAELRVYNATPNGDPINNGNMTLVRSFPLGQGTKFSVPAVDDGRVFVGTSDGRILQYGSPVEAALTGSTVTFPLTTQGTTSTQTATVTAQRTVTVTGVSVNNAVFTTGTPTPATPVTLTAGQTLSVPVTFSPTRNGQILATLTFDTDAGAVPLQLSGEGQTLAPKLVQSNCCVSFGGLVAGGPSASDTVTFGNQGAQDLIIEGYTLPAAPYTVTGLPPAGTRLAAGQDFTATFTFAPQNDGLYTDNFVIDTNDPTADFDDGPDGSINAGGVSLAGSAGTKGVMRIVPKDVNFGDVPVGTTATQPFTITNAGATNLNITISKDPGGVNGFTATTSLVEGFVIAPGQTVTQRVDFTPTTTGQLSAEWAITGDDGGGRQVVTFTGKGVPAAAPTLSVADLDVNRPAAGNLIVEVPVRLSAPSSSPVTVKYATKDGTATAPGDYAATTGTVAFEPGATAATIPVTINGTTPTPVAETLTVTLATPTGATIADAQSKLYLNTTYLPVSIAAGDTTAAVNPAGSTDLVFPVSVTPAPAPGQLVTVKYATADGTAKAADGDYAPVSSSLTFTADTPTQTVTVPLLKNPASGTKTVSLTLNTPSSGANVGDNSGMGTVYTTTQPLPALSVSDTALARPASGTVGATFTVSLSRAHTSNVPVSYTAAAGTGFTTADFAATSGTLIFVPGETSKTVTVPVNGSTTSTGTGNVNLNLSGQQGASLADSGGKAYVVSPLVRAFVSVKPATAWRSPSEDTTVNVPISLDAPAPRPITLQAATVDGTAKAGTDYLPAQTAITFAAGQTQAFLPVTIKGIAAVTPTVSFSVQLSGVTGTTQASSATAAVTIVSHTADATVPTERSAPTFTTGSVPATAQVGQPYDATVSASGNPEPAYSIVEGRLPDGINLDARTGQIKGTPTVPGSFTFRVGASNTVGTPASTGPLVIEVAGADAPAQFTAAAPPTSTKVGAAYSYTFAASGSPPATFAVASGSLPPGIGLDAASGVLSGSATATGSSTFTVSATNGVGSPATTNPITIAVATADVAPTFTNDTPPAGAVGAAYSYTFTASGSPASTFTTSSGSLPAGLALSSAGVLSGTPTATASTTFTVTATNPAGSATTDPITVTVTPANGSPVITAATPPGAATVGKAYSYAFAATGTPAPTFAVLAGTLPPGISLSAAGALSGTPTVDGTFSFSISATNDRGSDSTGQLTIVVAKAPAKPVFTASKPPTTATTGASYAYTFVASGTPTPSYGVASGALPPGLSLNAGTGELAGSPTTAGSFSFTVSATNAAGTVNTSKITVKVSVPPVSPVITSGPPPATAKVNTAYSFAFTATGQPAPLFSVASGALPAGLKLSTTGVLAGTPSKVATYTFSVKATNAAGTATSEVFTITTSR